MNYLKIIGGRALQGELEVQGAKNSVLPILAPPLPAPAGCGCLDPYSAPFGLQCGVGGGHVVRTYRCHDLR